MHGVGSSRLAGLLRAVVTLLVLALLPAVATAQPPAKVRMISRAELPAVVRDSLAAKGAVHLNGAQVESVPAVPATAAPAALRLTPTETYAVRTASRAAYVAPKTATGGPAHAPASGVLYAYEVCDACEADGDGYKIDGVLVSDFVTPAWFESFRKANSTQFDFGKKITKPFELRPEGYIGVYDVKSGGGWHQLTAQGTPAGYNMRPRLGSRRERRRTPRYEWLKSQPR